MFGSTILIYFTILCVIRHTNASYPVKVTNFNYPGYIDNSPKKFDPIDNLKKLAASVLPNMDTSKNPCDDFYEYACGLYNKVNSNLGARAFVIAEDEYDQRREDLIAGILKDNSTLAHEHFFQCTRDYVGYIGTRIPEVQLFLAEIMGMAPDDFMTIIGKLLTWREADFFLIPGVQPWVLNASTVYHVPLYPDTDTTNIDNFIHSSLMAASAIYDIMPKNSTVDLETAIKYAQLVSHYFLNLSIAANNVVSRLNGIPDMLEAKQLIRASFDNLQSLTPALNWKKFWNSVGVDAKDFAIYVPDYFSNLSQTISEISKDPDLFLGLKMYLEFQVYGFVDFYFNSGFDNVTNVTKSCNFAIYESIDLMPLYTQKYISDKSRANLTDMMSKIVQQLSMNMDEISWLDNSTRDYAKIKAGDFELNIGGPTEWKFPTIPVSESFFSSMIELRKATTYDGLSLASQPINRSSEVWNRNLFYLSPVNAYYDPSQNGIFIESPIISNPFYIEDAPLFYNYATIGFTLGHESTHGFDNNGRLFDGDGSYRNWWSESSLKEFNARKQCVIDFYSNSTYHLEYSANHTINGTLTQGENIADMGGVKFAYLAWQKALSEGQEIYSENDIQKIFQMSSEELFFVTYAQTWCEHPGEFFEDVHSPSPQRVRGPLTNSIFFQKIFQCKVGSNFHPTETLCEVW